MAGYQRRTTPLIYRKTHTSPRGDLSRRLVLDYLCEYVTAHGYAPSQHEIGAACFLSRRGVRNVLDGLQAYGYLQRQPRVWRGIRLNRKALQRKGKAA